MSRPEPDPETVVAVWRCKVDNPELSLRAIGDRFAISKTTVANYVNIGYEAESWSYPLDRAARRGAISEGLDIVAGWLLRERHGEHELDEKLAIIDRLLRTWAQQATLNGLNMPARIEISTDQANAAREKFASDATLAAVRDLQKRNEYDEAELKAGRPGVITPRGEDTA